MRVGKTLLVIGIMLTAAAVLLEHHYCWVFAMETFLRFVAVA